MGNGTRGGGAHWGILACAAAAAVLASPATAQRGEFDLLAHPVRPAEGTSLAAGGDGAAVFYASESSLAGSESEEDPNLDLFRWNPADDTVEQFTVTAGGGAVEPFSDQVAVDGRTVNLFGETGAAAAKARALAVAFRSNADPDGGGVLAELGTTGATVIVWDSERQAFDVAVGNVPTRDPYNLSSPSVALRARVIPGRVPDHSDDVPLGLEIRDVYAAFAGDLGGAADNSDGNDEIFLWTRSAFLEADALAGDVGDAALVQVTHTVADAEDDAAVRVIACSTPAVNRRGEVAFVSNADITGENPDRTDELFLWRKGRTRQLTDLERGTFAGLRWSPDGRVLVFESTGDLVRRNPDESSEIFSWNGRRLSQVTAGTTGGSFSPSADNGGRRIAFVTTADLDGLEIPTDAPEVVVATRGGRRLLQVTETADGDPEGDPAVTNESPVVSLTGRGRVLVTFVSSSDLDGRNSTHARRIWRTVVFENPAR